MKSDTSGKAVGVQFYDARKQIIREATGKRVAVYVYAHELLEFVWLVAAGNTEQFALETLAKRLIDRIEEN